MGRLTPPRSSQKFGSLWGQLGPRLIVKNGQDKLLNIAEAIHIETEEKSEDELAELNKEIFCNKGCVQNMAQLLLNFDDPDVTWQTNAALEKTNQAENQSS